MPYPIEGHKLINFASMIEDGTIEQAKQTAQMPFVYPFMALMPDAHQGMGAAVGTVIPTENAVIPAAVGVDIGCIDADTEVLTPQGWVRIAEWDQQPILAYRPEDDIAAFETPAAYINLPCSEFYHFKNSRGLDQMLSVEHRIAVWSGHKSRGYNFSVMSPATLCDQRLDKGYYCFKTTFVPDSPGVDMTDAAIRVEVMVQADGRIKPLKNGNCYVELHLRRERKIERAQKLLADAGIDFRVSTWKNGSTSISFTAPGCSKDLNQFWMASADQLRVVADEALRWDGHQGYRSYYSNTDRSAVDLVQYALAAAGVRAGIHSRVDARGEGNWEPLHSAILTKNEMVGFDYPSVVPAPDGRKYCFTTSTGFFVARRNGKIFITGNCGMIAAKTVFSAGDVQRHDRTLGELRQMVEDVIPMSPGNYNSWYGEFEFTEPRIRVLQDMAEHNDIKLEEHSPKWREQLGSLGGGNHFIELCRDEDAQIWMFLHSGSRGVGNKIANKHIKIAKKLCKMWHSPLPNDDLAFLPQGTPEFTRYIKELRWAQAFALANREEMMDRFRRMLCEWLDFNPVGIASAETQCEIERVNCHHNYTQIEQHGGKKVWVTRKGAIDASEGKMGLIPGSMGTRSYVVQGKGNRSSLNSAPHGAGRRMSRNQAKAQFTVEDLAARMEGIEYHHGEQWIDEIPDAYKDIDVVMRDAQPLVEIRHELTQLMNIKGE